MTKKEKEQLIEMLKTQLKCKWSQAISAQKVARNSASETAYVNFKFKVGMALGCKGCCLCTFSLPAFRLSSNDWFNIVNQWIREVEDAACEKLETDM
ncbi:hypothetical protein [Megasphaera sp.]|mgnify:CR=1 FL=1|uniref:hypothetical protein n=1 Tax=Megasphaera sp. TaxID=2023260 RepID=UPI00351FD46E